MKKTRLHIYLFFLFFSLSCGFVYGQQIMPVQSDERVSLFSDRTLYIAGENILFSAFVQNGNEKENSEISRVLYCEIIAPEGSKIAENKYVIDNSFSSGHLLIPNDITSGTYYLRAYTKYLRNVGPAYYSYIRIKIINANRTEVQTVTDYNSSTEVFMSEDNSEIGDNLFNILTEKSKYTFREPVNISIQSTEKIPDRWKALSISVVPEFSLFSGNVNLSENRQFENSIIYYPETRGLSITGKLIDNKTGISLSNARVNLSIIGRGRDFMAVKTDTSGRFFFALPDYSGYRDLFLCAENISNSDPKILVDNDYCKIPVHIPTTVFTLTMDERSTAYDMAVNLQLEKYFRNDSISDEDNQTIDEQAFYGNPNEIIYIDNYIQLPTLEEYFNGLPTLVKVRKRQGEKYFKILGPQTDLIEFDPLVMVDLVAIEDPAKILAIQPSNILRIEIVNELYVKGDQTYGGIINIISRRGDFAGIDLPSSGIFINYGFYSEENKSRSGSLLPKHIPDTRNTLFWDPHLLLNQDNTSKVSFLTSDTPGRYLIILDGINANGQTYRQTKTFEVVK